MPGTQPIPADILLEPWEWYVAGWRKLPPLPRQAPRPFDREDCLRRLARVRGPFYKRTWAPAAVGPHLDPGEGWFWLEAFTRAAGNKTPGDLAEEMRAVAPLNRMHRAGCAEALGAAKGKPAEVVAALASQVDLPTLLEMLLEHIQVASAAPYDSPCAELAAGSRKFVRPWLTQAEVASLQQLLRGRLRGHVQPRAGKPPPLAALCLMASFGLAEEALPLVSLENQLSSRWGAEEGSLKLFTLLGLEDPERIPGEMARLKVGLRGPDEIRGLIAALEEKALPLALPRVLRCTKRDDAEELTAPLGLVLRPQTARAMLVLSHKSQGPAPAQRWLDRHPELAVPGVLSLLGEEEHVAAGLNYLRQQARAGRQDLIDRSLEGLAPEVIRRVQRALDTTTAVRPAALAGVPSWFPPPPRRQPRLPAWLDAASLPPLRVEGRLLAGEAVFTLLAVLRESNLTDRSELLGQVKKQADPRTLDAFAWAVFDRWHSASGDAKDKWALLTLGLVGGDGVCLPLARLIEDWSRRSQSFRVHQGLQCLGAIGTRLAHLCLRRLAVTHSNAMGVEAESRFRELAHRNGLSVGEMEDRSVPDLGLDAEGYRRLVCCGATYRLTIGPDRQARLLDGRRQFLDEWPALAEGEDPLAVEEARGEWDLFRDQVREVVQMQCDRLERDLLTWRRWSVEDFRTWILGNGLMRHLARSLLWGAFRSLSDLRQAFRVTEAGTCVDAAGGAVPLTEEDSVGLVHPVLLAPDERLVWGDVLAEQGLAPPAWQLGRPVRPLRDQERAQRQLDRWGEGKLKLGRFADVSRRRGYESGATQRGHRCCRVRYFAAPDVTAYLLHTPVPESVTFYDNEQVAILGAQFRQGDTTGRIPNAEQALPLGSVDPVLLDEVIGLLDEIARAD
jgi:hypothetical protein